MAKRKSKPQEAHVENEVIDVEINQDPGNGISIPDGTELVFAPPGPDSPGHLMRVQNLYRLFQHVGDYGEPLTSVETIRRIIDMLLEYVEEPKDRKLAHAVLGQMSWRQYQQLTGAIIRADGEGGGENGVPLVPLTIKKT